MSGQHSVDLLTCSKMENIATKQYKCEICETELKNHNGLRQHFKNVHNFVKEHQCNICQKVFKLNHQLTSHVKIFHDNNRKHKEFKCDFCEKIFSA